MVSERLHNANVIIIGDIMLDKYIKGEVSRISPEAPVPVLKADKESQTLGGAANVAHNVALLKACCTVIGTAGKDTYRDTIVNLFDNLGVKHHLFDWRGGTTTKIRIVSGLQQIVRIDYENIIPSADSILNQAKEYCKNIIDSKSVVVISDYGKGLISEELCADIIADCMKKDVSTIVDPKGANWSKYKNATVITPNVKELSEAYGSKVENTDEAVVLAGKKIREKFNIKYLVVTRSERGISIIAEDLVSHFPTTAQEVFDVSGAGDTVVATLACMLGSGANISDAVVAANMAAGVAVSKVGTAPVSYAELLLAYNRKTKSTALTWQQAQDLVKECQRAGKTTVFSNGVFDILHRGHVEYLKQAKSLGDVLIIGVNSDDSVKRLKGPARPVNTQEDRAFLLSELECVDAVVIFSEDTPAELLNFLRPDMLVKGGDYKVEELAGREYVSKAVVLNFVDGYSTTATINKMK